MRASIFAATCLLLGCSPGADEGPPARPVVLTQLTFARAEDGVSQGFDLDGRTSSADDPDGCGKADYVDPEGNGGIDNATSGLMGLLELTEAAAVEPLIQQTVNSGELLLVLELVGLDDPVNDDAVDVWLWQGVGVPEIGNDGLIESGQTFDRDLAIDPSVVEGAALVDGVLTARGFDARLPIQIFDAAIDLTITNTAVRLVLGEEGIHSGVLAGAFQWDGLMESLNMAAIDAGLLDSLPGMLSNMSDLKDENGVCRVMSATLAFGGADAFFFQDEAPTE